MKSRKAVTTVCICSIMVAIVYINVVVAVVIVDNCPIARQTWLCRACTTWY